MGSEVSEWNLSDYCLNIFVEYFIFFALTTCDFNHDFKATVQEKGSHHDQHNPKQKVADLSLNSPEPLDLNGVLS